MKIFVLTQPCLERQFLLHSTQCIVSEQQTRYHRTCILQTLPCPHQTFSILVAFPSFYINITLLFFIKKVLFLSFKFHPQFNFFPYAFCSVFTADTHYIKYQKCFFFKKTFKVFFLPLFFSSLCFNEQQRIIMRKYNIFHVLNLAL